MLMRLFRYSSLVRLTCRLLVIAFKRGKNRLNIWVLRARAYSVTDGPRGNQKIRRKKHRRPANGQSVKLHNSQRWIKICYIAWIAVIKVVIFFSKIQNNKEIKTRETKKKPLFSWIQIENIWCSKGQRYLIVI